MIRDSSAISRGGIGINKYENIDEKNRGKSSSWTLVQYRWQRMKETNIFSLIAMPEDSKEEPSNSNHTIEFFGFPDS